MKRKTSGRKRRLVRIVSLGCPKNFVDTEQAAASLFMHGFGIASTDDEADVMFINTCAFLASAREEAAETLRYAENWKQAKPDRVIICGGCIVSWDRDGAFRRGFPAVDSWLPPACGHDLGGVIETALSSADKAPVCAPDLDAARFQLTPRHYAWLRISDGCCNHCSYCLIPSIRGELRSRSMKSVVSEADNLLRSGVKELLVIAQDTAGYGMDFDGRSHLPELLKSLDSFSGDYLIRLMYLHPVHITRELIDAMCGTKHLVRCLEIPIQHVADGVLRRMNRHIGEKRQRAVLDELREKGFAIRTTLMTGFPGETEEDFRNLRRYVEEMKFERLGVFAWSEEPGTPAAAMKGKVPGEERERRRDVLMTAQKKISRSLNRSLLGRECEVIVDRLLPGGEARGRTMLDVPGIDNDVTVKGLPKKIRGHRGPIPGSRIFIRVEHAGIYGISGTYVPDRDPKKGNTEKA